jgi:hypothetical protein
MVHIVGQTNDERCVAAEQSEASYLTLCPMTNDVNRKTLDNRTSGNLFCLAGLLFVLSGLIDGDIGLYISIGIMNMCIGMKFFSMAESAKKTQGDNHQKAEVPNKADTGEVGKIK